MMKIISTILVFLFLCGGTVASAENVLPEHEKLTYNVSWLGFGVGTLVISVNGIKNINGRNTYVLEAVAKSRGLLSGLKKIDSKFISYFDVEKFYPLRQEIYRNDGSCKDKIIIDFDQVNHKAYHTDLNKNTHEVYSIANNAQDVLSNYYYFMLAPLKVGDMLRCPVLKGKYSYSFSGFVESKDRIKVRALGNEEKEAFLLYPYAEKKLGKIYKGHTSVYYSCDKRRIPYLMKSKALKFGQLVVTLAKIEK